MKKEPYWDLSINTEAGGTPSSATPRKRGPKATPKKQNMKAENGSDSSDDGDDFSPTKKKAPLNKVHSGRIAKTTPTRGKSVKSYVEVDEEDDDMAVKDEADARSFNSAFGAHHEKKHANGNGNG